MSKYARTKPGSNTLYYLPEFEVLYIGGKPTLIYKPIQLAIGPVATEEINETLEYTNDADNWIKVNAKHLDQIKAKYDQEIPNNNAEFFAKLRQETGLPPYDEKRAKKAFTSFESFYQLAAMPSKKII